MYAFSLDFDSRKKVPEPHKVILSHETSDKILYIPKECSYVEFLDKIAVLYPQLENVCIFPLSSLIYFKDYDVDLIEQRKNSIIVSRWWSFALNCNRWRDL